MFFETIRCHDGKLKNLDLHAERLARTARRFFPGHTPPDITRIAVPEPYRRGLYRCRVRYAGAIEQVEFMPYVRRSIATIALVEAPALEYGWKFTDRDALNALPAIAGADEAVIVKNGGITDTTFTNLVFQNAEGLFTPCACLLPGVRRAALLRSGAVREAVIRVEDLPRYGRMLLVNAMLGLEDAITFAIRPDGRGGVAFTAE